MLLLRFCSFVWLIFFTPAILLADAQRNCILALASFCRAGDACATSLAVEHVDERAQKVENLITKLIQLLEAEALQREEPRAAFATSVHDLLSEEAGTQFAGIQNYLEGLSEIEISTVRRSLGQHVSKMPQESSTKWNFESAGAKGVIHAPLEFFDGLRSSKAHFIRNTENARDNKLIVYRDGRILTYSLPLAVDRLGVVIAGEGDVAYVTATYELKEARGGFPAGRYESLLQVSPVKNPVNLLFGLKVTVNPVEGDLLLVKVQDVESSLVNEFYLFDPKTGKGLRQDIHDDSVPLESAKYKSELGTDSEKLAPAWYSKSRNELVYFRDGQAHFLKLPEKPLPDARWLFKYLNENLVVLTYASGIHEHYQFNDQAVVVDLATNQFFEFKNFPKFVEGRRETLSYPKEMRLTNDGRILAVIGEYLGSHEERRAVLWDFRSKDPKKQFKILGKVMGLNAPRRDGLLAMNVYDGKQFLVYNPKLKTAVKVDAPVKLESLSDEREASARHSGDFFKDTEGRVFRYDSDTGEFRKVLNVTTDAISLAELPKKSTLFAITAKVNSLDRHYLYFYQEGMSKALQVEVFPGEHSARLSLKNVKSIGRDFAVVTLESYAPNLDNPGEIHVSSRLLLVDLARRNTMELGHWDVNVAADNSANPISVEAFGDDGMFYVFAQKKLKFYQLVGDSYNEVVVDSLIEKAIVYSVENASAEGAPALYLLTGFGARLIKQEKKPTPVLTDIGESPDTATE